jgi:hypothetical protein
MPIFKYFCKKTPIFKIKNANFHKKPTFFCKTPILSIFAKKRQFLQKCRFSQKCRFLSFNAKTPIFAKTPF